MIGLTVTKVIEETPDTNTYVFETTGKEPFSYKAGQFITLMFNRNGNEVRRSYSMSSAPAFDDHTAFTVKRVPNGDISRYLLLNLNKGSTLISLEAAGRFTFDADESASRDIYLIAAGSGITPVYSILKEILQTTKTNHVKLFLQNRDERSVIFNDSLHLLETKFERNFKFWNYLSGPIDTHKPSRRLNNEILERLISREMNFRSDRALFYICGPLAFMRMAEFTIRRMGFSPEQIKKENFDVPRLPPPSFMIDENPRSIILSRQKSTKILSVRYPSSILDAALSNNINIPFSCKAGICGSCVVKCTSGEVKMKYNDVLTEQEVTDGLVLTCVGYAVTDIVLDL